MTMNKELKQLLCVAAACLLVAACDDDGQGLGDDGGMVVDDGGSSDGGGNTDADGGNGDSAGLCPGEGDAVLSPLPSTVAFGVISGGGGSASIGFLDEAGDVVVDTWIDSGTTSPILTSTLGGDVVFASGDPSDEAITLIDRFGKDVVTRLCRDGTLLGQVRLTPESVSLNVRDLVLLGDGRGFASRYNQNPAMDAATTEIGNDLIGFDEQSLEANGMRVDLTELNSMEEGIDPENGMPATDVEVWARPGNIVRRGDTLVVGLSRLPAVLSGAPRAFGQGAVALVDVDDLSVEGFTLPGSLANCDQVLPVTGSTTDVIVSCKGYSNLGFGDEPGERATTGIVRLTIDAEGMATVVSSWEAASTVDGPIPAWNTVSLGGDIVVTVDFGDFVAETDDVLYRIDLSDGETTEVATASGQFKFGQGAFRDGLLIVPDAEAGALRRFSVSGATLTEGDPVTVGPAALDLRSVRSL